MSKKNDQDEVRRKMFEDAKMPEAPKVRKYYCSYYQERCDEVITSGMQGHFPVQMARDMSVHPDTLYEWDKMYPEFSKAFEMAKVVASAWWLDLAKVNMLNKEFNTALYTQITRTQRGSLGYNGRRVHGFKEAKTFTEKLAIVDELFSVGAITLAETEKLYALVEKHAKIVETNDLAKILHELNEDKKQRDLEAKNPKNKAE
jgi:hypothetical protein